MGKPSKKLSIITPTGDRYDALKMAFRHMKRQSFLSPEAGGQVEWVIVDDGRTQATAKAVAEQSQSELANLGITMYHVRQKSAYPYGPQSLASNIINGIHYVSADKILIWEDDDCYLSGYLEDMWDRLQEAEAVGTVWQKYYHLPSRSYRVFRNRGSALCSTGMSADLLPILFQAASHCLETNNKGLDAFFWKVAMTGAGTFDIFEPERDLMIGIKGMPGREGIGVGHRPKKFRPDPNLTVLQKWVGLANLRVYQPFTKDQGGA